MLTAVTISALPRADAGAPSPPVLEPESALK
jgi:hypothetical protein